MISEENKFKFINGEYIDLGQIQIWAEYILYSTNRAHSIFGQDYNLDQRGFVINLFFGKKDDIWCSRMFLNYSYEFKSKFEHRSYEGEFNNLSENLRLIVLEYASWITSKEGEKYVLFMNEKLGIYR